MAYLARTRAGVKEFLAHTGGPRHLWMDKDVLSEEEIELLREYGHSVSVFIHGIDSPDDIADALITLQEHHPNEATWVEGKPSDANPRSADIGQALLWNEWIVGVTFAHNDLVVVTTGTYAGQRGSIVTVVSLRPEPTYIIELESGTETQAKQAWLQHVNES